jgi:impB/mucB/samB family
MDEGRIRKIIHIDMDAFYASVEQRDDPTLKGKPVAVGYPAKRGVVAAASYEARSFGVRSAMPSIIAARKCPELMFVPPRFDVYREVSNQVQAIFKDYTPLVEPLSLDEAYLDITDNLRGIPTAWETAKEIRARIYEEPNGADLFGASGMFEDNNGQNGFWTASIPIDKGMSGGPVYDSSGDVVALSQGAAGLNPNYLIPLRRIQSILNDKTQARSSCSEEIDMNAGVSPLLSDTEVQVLKGIDIIYYQKAKDGKVISDALSIKGLSVKIFDPSNTLLTNLITCTVNVPAMHSRLSHQPS